LTKVEENNPFRFHESIAHRKVVVIDDATLEEIEEEAVVIEDAGEVADSTEVKVEDGANEPEKL
jgi:hypothetical protein